MGDVTIESGKALLDMLAEDSDDADEFRRFILRQSTTYYGESDNWYSHIHLSVKLQCISEVFPRRLSAFCRNASNVPQKCINTIVFSN